MIEPLPPDIILLGGVWPERALLRAQLIEEGYDVVAIDAWPMPDLYQRPGMGPRLLIVDLQRLDDPRDALDGIRLVMPPARVLVIAALATVPIEDITRLGYQVVSRPASIRGIVDTATALLRQSKRDD